MLLRSSLPISGRSPTILRHIRSKTTQPNDYQFLQRCTLPMLHFQASLPRLPIPLLEKTCERYLAAVQPLLAPSAFAHTTRLVTDFKSNAGMDLQSRLKQQDLENKNTSYISQPWFEMYLRDRTPLPVNYNPLLMMKHDVRPAYNNQLVRASNLVVSSLRFMRSLRAECLAPEIFHMNAKQSDTDRFRTIARMAPSFIATYVAYAFKAFPLDMSQYVGLFGATRIPELDKDSIYRNGDSKHLLVVRNGHLYSVDVLDKDGEIEPAQTIVDRLKHILDKAPPMAEYPLGALTSENRNTWAKLRAHLHSIGNAEALERIDSALFCLCLDNATVYDESNPGPTVQRFLYGNTENRWFDKSVSVVVSDDGTAGINFEHSWGDGVAVLRYFNEIFTETTTSPLVHPENVSRAHESGVGVHEIEINIDDRMRDGIKTARANHQSVCDSLDINFLQYDGFGKNLCKKQRISPDSVMQLGFQLGFFKQHGHFVGTYESCSTSAFRHGRTETMRPCTMLTKQFCDAISQRNRPSNAELRAMMEKCSAMHNNLTKEAAMGQGFDRHLFGLRTIADQAGMARPALYDDEAYALINHNIISTSTLSSPALLAGGFGPVVKDGYGIGYHIQDNNLGTVFTSYKGQQNGSEFVEALREAYSDIQKVLEST